MTDKAKLLSNDKEWTEVLCKEQMDRSITRIAHEILESNEGTKSVAIVGIRTRGDFIARRVQAKIKEIESVEVPLGVVDITLYRDDLGTGAEQPVVRGTDLPFDIDKKVIVLVDDVLYTGRTVRSALDAIIDFGRPIKVQLAVLCDRGHRELPIRADFVGKNVATAPEESVRVRLNDCDGEEGVYVKLSKGAK